MFEIILYSEVLVQRKDREIKDPAEIMSLLQKVDVCRLAMSDDNVPYIVTLNYGLKKEEGRSTFTVHAMARRSIF